MSVIVKLFNWFTLVVVLLFAQLLSAQNKMDVTESQNDNVVMTWRKNTPEQEMKDDIKALADYGVTVKYSGVKRNSKGEITAIKVDYKDRKGNKGTLEYDQEQPITDIVLFKQNGTIGFGAPAQNDDIIAMNDIFGRSFGGNNMPPFGNGFSIEGMPDMKEFNFTFGNGEGFSGKSRMIIKENGKKPLVIEDGKVVEGGDDYTKEELDEILKNNKMSINGFGEGSTLEFDFRNPEGLEQFKEKVKSLRGEFSQDRPSEEDLEKTRTELEKAKEEMVKAREELEKAKKALEREKKATPAKPKKA